MAQELDIGGTIETVELATLKTDPDYQRSLKPHHKKIAKKFDRRAAGLLVVNMRPNGDLMLIDGQQRVAAMKILGITHWTARVFKLPSIEQEADLFARLNGGEGTVAKVGERDRFRALVLSKNPQALELIQAVEKAGMKLPVGFTSSQWPYVNSTALLTSYQRSYGVEPIYKTMKILHDAWTGDADAVKHIVVESVLTFVCTFPQADMERAARRFSTVPAFRVAQEGKKGTSMSRVSHKAGREFLVKLYNNKLLTKNKLGYKEEKLEE